MSLMTITCEAAEGARRGRGPPAVPSRMSRVFVFCEPAYAGRSSVAAPATAPASQVRRSIFMQLSATRRDRPHVANAIAVVGESVLAVVGPAVQHCRRLRPESGALDDQFAAVRGKMERQHARDAAAHLRRAGLPVERLADGFRFGLERIASPFRERADLANEIRQLAKTVVAHDQVAAIDPETQVAGRAGPAAVGFDDDLRWRLRDHQQPGARL